MQEHNWINQKVKTAQLQEKIDKEYSKCLNKKSGNLFKKMKNKTFVSKHLIELARYVLFIVVMLTVLGFSMLISIESHVQSVKINDIEKEYQYIREAAIDRVSDEYDLPLSEMSELARRLIATQKVE